MAGSATWPLQVAVVAALEADPVFAGPPVVPVFSGLAPAGTRGDYVTIGDVAEYPVRVFGNDGSRVTLTLHLWPLGLGRHGVATLYAGVRRALDRQTLTLVGHVLVQGLTRFAVDLPDPPSGRRHGVAEYEALTYGTA